MRKCIMANRTCYRLLEQQAAPDHWRTAGVAFEEGGTVSLWLPAAPQTRTLGIGRLQDLSDDALPSRDGWRWSEQVQESPQQPFQPLDAFRLSQGMGHPDASLTPPRFLERLLVLRSTSSSRLEVRYGHPDAPPGETVTAPSGVSAETVSRVGLHVAQLNKCRQTDLSELGSLLASVAVPQKIRTGLLADLREAVRTRRRIRLRILDRDGVVSGWPWEFLYLPELETGYLSLHPACSLVRACPPLPQASPFPRPTLAGQTLEVLLVWADPAVPPYDALTAESQVDMVTQVLHTLAPWGVRCRVLGPRQATRANLQQALRERPAHLVYFLAHGDFDAARGEGVVILEVPNGGRYEAVPASELAALFADCPETCLILLESCQSSSRGPQGKGVSVAEALAGPGRAVLGMQFSWPAAASGPFWRVLFTMLTVPQPLDDALFAAREWVARMGPDLGDWGCPVLYRTGSLAESAERETPRIPTGRSELSRLVRDSLTQLARLVREGAGDNDLLGLSDELEAAMVAAAERGRGSFGDPMTTADRLHVMLAGPEDQAVVIRTTPVWCTQLLAAPEQLSWSLPVESGPWQVRLWTVRHPLGAGGLHQAVVDAPLLDLPPALRAALHADGRTPTLWGVWPAAATAADRPLVRGAFLVLPPGQAQTISLRLGELQALPEGLRRELAVADLLHQAGLYEALRQHLVRLENVHRRGTEAFAVRRALAALYNKVHDELDGKRFRWGEPEGAWANQLAREYVLAAYEALGLS
jgi:hypothetical protein